MMHGSSAGRPRQRTFTSCTECRRRKQRCNQAKDRPCNNCSRRYPPVVCTYHQSASPPPSFDRIVDLRDEQVARQDYQTADRGMSAPGPSYMQTTQSDTSGLPATSMSDHNFYDNSRTYYSGSTTRHEYRTYAGDSSQHVVSSNVNYAPVDQSYYQSTQLSYSSAPATHSSYYSTSTTQGGGDWLSTNGDPSAFVGAGSADYYYVCDPDLDHNGPLSPRR